MPVLLPIVLKQTARTGMVVLTLLCIWQTQLAAAQSTADTPEMASSQTKPLQAADHAHSAAPAYASVQENLKAMDQDGDGQVSVLELRAYLEARHGKGYEQKVMDDLEASAKGKSCATPFAQSFY